MGTALTVDVRGVSKSFGHGRNAVQVLNDVSVKIAEREFFTLLGPSGCGKTTLLRLIAGFEDVDRGDIFIAGQRVNDQPPFRRNVNTVFQSYALFPHLTVQQNAAFGLRMKDLPREEIKRRANEALEMVRMSALANRRPSELSGGQQQRVALARALAPRPQVLLLDEPLSALDLKLRKEMQIELKQLQNQAGITFIFVTHDQEEALGLSDRIGVMNDGVIMQVGKPIDIYERPTHRFVANFIGDINLLEAKVSNGKALLKSGHLVECDVSAHSPSSSVSLAIRPERARIVKETDTEANFAGIVDHFAYMGTAHVYQIRLLEGTKFLLRETTANGAGQFAQVGSRVGIKVAPEAIRVLRD